MKADDRRVIMASIDALAEELKQVIDIAKKRGADDVWLLTYVVAELPYVFGRDSDVQVSKLSRDVRLP